MNELEKARSYKIVKDNSLIRKRRFELSVLEQKVLGFILSLIRPEAIQNENSTYKYEFEIKTFCKICGIREANGKNYENIKKALKKLADNSFWLEEPNGDEFYFQWIVTPRIKKQTGIVVIKISEDVMPYLINLQKRFTSYELYQILALKSSYSIALYELFKSYSYQKKVNLSIEEIKKYLCIVDKYAEYKSFRRRIIEPAIEEINTFTDLTIEWKPKRDGKFYKSIDFNILIKEKWDGLEAYRRTIKEISK